MGVESGLRIVEAIEKLETRSGLSSVVFDGHQCSLISLVVSMGGFSFSRV